MTMTMMMLLLSYRSRAALATAPKRSGIFPFLIRGLSPQYASAGRADQLKACRHRAFSSPTYLIWQPSTHDVCCEMQQGGVCPASFLPSQHNAPNARRRFVSGTAMQEPFPSLSSVLGKGVKQQPQSIALGISGIGGASSLVAQSPSPGFPRPRSHVVSCKLTFDRWCRCPLQPYARSRI